MPHQRLGIDGTGTAQAVKAGSEIFLRGRTGAGLDAATQAEHAMRDVAALLAEAGSAMSQVCKVTVLVTDRAFLADVRAVVVRHLGSTAAVGTDLIVNGLARPEMLVAIDIDAVIPGGAA